MYGLIRILVVVVIVALLFLAKLWLRVEISQKMQYVFLSIALVLLLSFSLLPFENVFYTFDSPRAVYKYMSFNNTETDVIIEGDKCDYVIGKTTKEKTFTSMIIPKTDRGYKIAIGLKTKIRNVMDGLPRGCTVTIVEYGDDFFVEISFLSPGAHEVTSNEDAAFTVRKHQISEGEELFEYYVHISDKESFRLSIDGTDVDIFG